MKNLGMYAKSVLAAVTAVLGPLATYLATQDVKATWATAIIGVATALGVYRVPNKKPAK